MKIKSWLACLAGVVMAAPLMAAVSEYRVTLTDEDPRVASVHASLTLSESTLKMLPWGHPWLTHGWATFVDDLEARHSVGCKVELTRVEEDGWGSWRVAADDGERLELTYTVRFDHDQHDWNRAGGQDSRPALSHGALFLISRACSSTRRVSTARQ